MTSEERFERIERTLDSVGQRLDSVGQRLDSMATRIDDLTAFGIQHAERMSEFDLAMDKLLSSQKQLLTAQVLLTDQQTRTDAKLAEVAERLNILIEVVMRREKS